MTKQLDTIYRFVKEDLEAVGARIMELGNVEHSQTAQILKYILETGGKKIRPALALMAGGFYRYDREHHVSLAAAVELLHMGTLLHDDTMDKAMTRHGKATPNIVWGDRRAVLVGDLVFANAAEQAARTGNLRVIELFARTLKDISSGELLESLHVFKAEQGRQEYFFRIGHKTASLFAAASEGAAILSQAPEEAVQALKDYGHYLGLSFQIVDDILDIVGDEHKMGKPIGSDILSGIVTLPALLVVERDGNNRALEEVFSQRGNKALFRKFLDRMQNPDIIDESYQVALDFINKARQSLDILPERPVRQGLAELADYILQREN